ncbi:hypothetical protein [Synechococcus sp. PCC 6312]|uniref:hypothetical protein n=1 Tax=Synechococcus sp. (strain ATCC 27167 / PCC 6312) TaxID=195253 RepID=UPI00029EC775|nr:hypothetical protein [Synechococcus sp. PCC 6312]AFY59511.1 hypothetical protein Syn6312_0272 [Synechococcus sp. PCC 6312]
MKQKAVFCLVLGLVSFPLVAHAEPYPTQAVNQFVSACQDSFQSQIPGLAAKGGNYCRCVIQELQTKLTFDQFKQLGGTLSPNDSASLNNPVLVDTAQICMSKTLQ